MKWLADTTDHLSINNTRLEYRVWGPSPDKAPTIVLLHEGLGSCNQWRDFPQQLADKTGHGVFAYSRAGYGASDPAKLPLPLDFIEREAMDVLPKVLDAIGFRKGTLLGHSDGASIAAVYMGSLQDFRVNRLCLIAPHFFTEPMGLNAITEARNTFATSDLRTRLAKHHRNPEAMFRGWNNAWLDPGFKVWNIEDAIPYIRVPVLAIQGRDDQYGTLAQIDTLEKYLESPFERLLLDDCKHAPHIEKPDVVLTVVADFIGPAQQ